MRELLDALKNGFRRKRKQAAGLDEDDEVCPLGTSSYGHKHEQHVHLCLGHSRTKSNYRSTSG